MPILRSVVAKQCEEPGCPRQRQHLDRHEGFCEECGQPLAPVLVWSLPRLALALGAPLVLAVLAWALTSYIANRPHPLNDARRQELDAWVRASGADRVVTQQEKTGLARIIGEQRLNPQEAGAYVKSVRQRLEESRQDVARGFQLAAQQRYEEASREYLRAVENDPENAAAWVNLGLTNAALGHENEALDQYSRALRLDPKSWHAHYSLGLLWARRGDTEQALRHLEESFANLPASASRERRSMIKDMREAVVSTSLQRDQRFQTFLTRLGGS